MQLELGVTNGLYLAGSHAILFLLAELFQLTSF